MEACLNDSEGAMRVDFKGLLHVTVVDLCQEPATVHACRWNYRLLYALKDKQAMELARKWLPTCVADKQINVAISCQNFVNSGLDALSARNV